MIQAVILAAGKSTRCYPLTLTRPKPLLKIANKSILEHTLAALEGIVDEAILIVGYKKEMIENAIGKKHGKIRVKYVTQPEQLGTAHALLTAEPEIKDRFLVLNGDDIFKKEDIKKTCRKKYAILAMEVSNPEKYGVVTLKDDYLNEIIEKPEQHLGNLINTGCYMLDKKIFPIIRKLPLSKRGEYEITSAVTELAKTDRVSVIKATRWLSHGYPWDPLTSNEVLLDELKVSKIKGKIEDNVTIHGFVEIGEGTIIKSGTYIEGPVVIGKDSEIGPNCYLRGRISIGNKCKVGNAVEIKNSIIMDNTKVPHLSYIGDSIIGENSNLGAGTITANLRHDHGNIRSRIGNVLVDTGRKKLGVITGDNVQTGVHTSIYPGRKIWPGKTTTPGETVKEDII